MTNDSVNWGFVVLVVQYGTGSPPVWLLAVVCRAWAIPNVPGSTPSNSAAALVWREKLLLSLNGRRSSDEVAVRPIPATTPPGSVDLNV